MLCLTPAIRPIMVTSKISKCSKLSYHVTRDCIFRGMLKFEHMSTNPNIAGIVTKGVEEIKYWYMHSKPK